MRFQLSLFCVLFSLVSDVQAGSDIDKRIARIEQGLRGPVAVQGEAGHTMALAERMRTWNVPGVSIAVVNNGRVEWARGYGVTEAGKAQRVTVDTLFQAASISKLVTATGAMALAERGKLNLDQDVNHVLNSWKIPASPELQQSPVTPRRLLNHTAGTTVEGLDGYAADGPVPTLLDVLNGRPPANAAPVRVDAVPGSAYRYSGGGYAVLQLLMTERSGSSFASAIESTVLKPARMTRSTFSLPDADNVAAGHDLQGSTVAGRWHIYPELAAAGLWSTPTDLAKLMVALQRSAAGKSRALLTAATMKQMMTSASGEYGLGMELDHEGPDPTFAHSGSNLGYKAMLFAYVGKGKGAVVMTNGDYGSMLIDEILRAIAHEYGWNDYRQHERKAVSYPEHLGRFVGKYSIGGLPLTVTTEHGKLFAEAAPLGPQRLELIPEGEGTFFMREKESTISFALNGTGPVADISFFDFGRARPGKRMQ